MDIPFQAIARQTLYNMIEELITRDGTDYGEYEMELAEKVAQVMLQLEKGDAVIQYDEALEICEIVLVKERGL